MNEPTKPVMMDPSEIHVDPELRALMPRLSNAEFALLRESIKNAGIRDPVIVFLDPETGMRVVLDGDNRRAIAIKLKLKLPVMTIEVACRAAAMEWAINNQLGRRNLAPFARVRLALMLKAREQEAAKERQRRSLGAGQKGQKKSDGVSDKNGQVYTRLGEIAGVSHDTVRKVERIIEHAPSDLIKQLERSEIRINTAHELIKPTKRKEPKPTTAEDGEQNGGTEGGRRAAGKNSRLTPAKKRRGSKSSNQDRKAPEKQDVSSSAEADSEGTPSPVAAAVAGDADDECRDGTSERPDTEGEGDQETEDADTTETTPEAEDNGAVAAVDSVVSSYEGPTYPTIFIRFPFPNPEEEDHEPVRDLIDRVSSLPINDMANENTVGILPAPRQWLAEAAVCLLHLGFDEIVPVVCASGSSEGDRHNVDSEVFLVGAKDLNKLDGLRLVCESDEIIDHIETHIGAGAIVFATELREGWDCYNQDIQPLEREDSDVVLSTEAPAI